MVLARPRWLKEEARCEVLFELLSHVWIFWDSMDCSPSGFSVHGIYQARILEWIAISFSRVSSRPRDQILVFHTAGGFFTLCHLGPGCEVTQIKTKMKFIWEGNRQEGQWSPNGGNSLQVSDIFISLKWQEDIN